MKRHLSFVVLSCQMISSWCNVVHPPCVFYSWEESTGLVVARHFKSCIEEISMRITADKVLRVRLHDFRRCCHEWCCSQVHVSEIHGWCCSSSKKKTCTIDDFIISSCGATFVLRCLVMPLEPHLISSWCVFDRFLPCREKRKSFCAISSLHLHLAVLCVFRHDHVP